MSDWLLISLCVSSTKSDDWCRCKASSRAWCRRRWSACKDLCCDAAVCCPTDNQHSSQCSSDSANHEM